MILENRNVSVRDHLGFNYGFGNTSQGIYAIWGLGLHFGQINTAL